MQTAGSFVGALCFAGLVASVGAAAWLFVGGTIQPLAAAAPVP